MTLVDELIKSKKLRKKYLTTESQRTHLTFYIFTPRGLWDLMVTVFTILSYFRNHLIF